MPRRLLLILMVVLIVSLVLLCACSAAVLLWRRGRCTGHRASMRISATDTRVQVGDTLTVTVTLHNMGCVDLGLPQYRLYLESEGQDILAPARPEPVVHSLGVDPGDSDLAEFALQAVGAGRITLRATASFEVHLGYPGPAYWGSAGSDSLVVIVER